MDLFFCGNANCIINDINSIWLGDNEAANDIVFLKKNNIHVIINCTKNLPFIYENSKNLKDLEKLKTLETFRIPVNDFFFENPKDISIMQDYLPQVINFILKKFIIEKKNILIHCHKGKQRSACIMLAILYELISNSIINIREINTDNRNQLMNEIIIFLQKKRPCIFTYGLKFNFKKALENFFNIKISF